MDSTFDFLRKKLNFIICICGINCFYQLYISNLVSLWLYPILFILERQFGHTISLWSSTVHAIVLQWPALIITRLEINGWGFFIIFNVVRNRTLNNFSNYFLKYHISDTKISCNTELKDSWLQLRQRVIRKRTMKAA